mmetsp:Transcript_8775/g.25242  ORF Transcript_8775/g.25242 Transcript_8775/m.25242 type:complete len:221 (+) Transcript_8775:1137-1799(+)
MRQQRQSHRQDMHQGRPHQLRQNQRRLPVLLQSGCIQKRRSSFRILRVRHRGLHHLPGVVAAGLCAPKAAGAVLRARHLQGHQAERIRPDRRRNDDDDAAAKFLHHDILPDPVRRHGCHPAGTNVRIDDRRQPGHDSHGAACGDGDGGQFGVAGGRRTSDLQPDRVHDLVSDPTDPEHPTCRRASSGELVQTVATTNGGLHRGILFGSPNARYWNSSRMA